MRLGTIKQILIITDGCSNMGESPVAMASLAKEHGITVNVIGVVQEGKMGNDGMKEIEGIALAGGGISQVVYATQLSQTVQMVTHKAMTQTLQGIVNKQLKQILGNQETIESLPPDKRGEILEYVDEVSETSRLEVVILIDCSASMSSKLDTVKESLFDLSISLGARVGENDYSIFVFPGKETEVELVLDWNPNLQNISAIFSKLIVGGMTPTGPAIKQAIMQFRASAPINRIVGYDEDYTERTGY